MEETEEEEVEEKEEEKEKKGGLLARTTVAKERDKYTGCVESCPPDFGCLVPFDTKLIIK